MSAVRQDLVSPRTGNASDLSRLLERAKEEEAIMNKLWLLFLLVIPYQAIHAQEVKHAPTVENVALTRSCGSLK